jgi:hypothetical protein
MTVFATTMPTARIHSELIPVCVMEDILEMVLIVQVAYKPTFTEDQTNSEPYKKLSSAIYSHGI